MDGDWYFDCGPEMQSWYGNLVFGKLDGVESASIDEFFMNSPFEVVDESFTGSNSTCAKIDISSENCLTSQWLTQSEVINLLLAVVTLELNDYSKNQGRA